MFQEIIERLALALEGRGIPYMLIGGQAVLLHGEPRLTKDIDLTIDRDAQQAEEILALVRHLGWNVLVENPPQFVQETMVLPCLDPVSGIRLDFIFSFSPYEKQALGRVRRVPMGKAQVRFASLEDLIIHKMVAGRPRDEEDVRNLLSKRPPKRPAGGRRPPGDRPPMDLAYVQRWLKEFQGSLSKPVLERFNAIWKEQTR